MKPSVYDIQIRLFEQIKHSIPENVSLIDELRTVLNMSDNSIYRRICGETEISLSEAELLSSMYGVSLDALCGFKGNTVAFDFHLMRDVKDFHNYLLAITHDLEKVSRNKNARVIYAGEDIPLFYNFGSDDLAKFKYFYWMKFVMNVNSLQHVKYNPDLISDDIVKAGIELANLYASLTTIEIWTDATALSLFKQILYLWESGQFETKEVALAVSDAVGGVFRKLEQAATLGYKTDSNGNRISPESTYQLYLSDTEIGNNCILTDVDGVSTVYLAFNTFNKLTTRHRFFCDVTRDWLQSIISRSTLISGVSEKSRLQFFIKLHSGLDDLRKKIENGEDRKGLTPYI
jgi:hypothetical protein